MPETIYDFLLVGAGLYNAVLARKLTDAGKKVLVIDKRPHIAGNCYTKKMSDINVHYYGAHIMHTSDSKVWEFICNYTQMNNYTNRVRVNYKEKIYSFPINMNTLNQLYGVVNPQQARDKINAVCVPCENPANLEEWILSQVGKDIYQIFIKGYTTKQWGRSPKELPASIVKRLPIRYTYNDNYFNDRYQGIPAAGYTQFFNKLFEGVEVRLSQNYLDKRDYWNKLANVVVYSGGIDEFFNYKCGELEWRSLTFDHHVLTVNDYQGTGVINYTAQDVPYTRILEHKHFEYTSVLPDQGKTIITKEYPANWSRGKEAYYPVRDSDGKSWLFNKYQNKAKKLAPKFYFKGRLAEYIYRDMCPTIREALRFAVQLIEKAG